MAYPSAIDYFSAVQHPAHAFRLTSLKTAEFARDPLMQTPIFASGNSAVVFKATVDGNSQALRFFIREDASTRDRYTAFGNYFRDHDLTDCVAASEWLDNAIDINGSTWPVLRMQWVDGRTLDSHVGELVQNDNRKALEELAFEWRRLVARLQAARFAHGDLQHGNVLVEATGSLRLVDFDGSWIAPFEGRQQPPNEQGHPNYQPRNRTWGEWMDTFPGLLVYVSLLALSRNTQPWRDLYDEDNLLFQRADFAPPYQTRAWNQMAGIGDDQVDRMLQLLRQTCADSWKAGRLEDLLQASGVGITDWVWELERKRSGRRQPATTPEPVTQPEGTRTLSHPRSSGDVWWRQAPAGTTHGRPAGWEGWGNGSNRSVQHGVAPSLPHSPSNTQTPSAQSGQGQPGTSAGSRIQLG